MPLTLNEETLQDELAMQVACIVAIANRVAQEEGFEPTQYLLWVRQEIENEAAIWRVDYMPKAYIHQRGGGFSVEIDAQDGHIISALRGQ